MLSTGGTPTRTRADMPDLKPKPPTRRHDITVRLNDDEHARLMAAIGRAGIKPTRAGGNGTSEFVRAWTATLPPAADLPPPGLRRRPQASAYHPG